MKNATNGLSKFDWLGFIGRQLPILVLATWWLVKAHENERVGAFVLAGGVSVVLTALNYLRARRV